MADRPIGAGRLKRDWGDHQRGEGLQHLDDLLAHVCVDEEVAGPDAFSRSEAPFITAADQERMFGRGLPDRNAFNRGAEGAV